MKPITKRQIRIAGIYSVTAFGLFLGVFLIADPPPFTLWVGFAAAFVFIEYRAVEVNDRMFQSSGLMVLLSAGTFFSLRPGSSAVFAMAAMAGLAAVTPTDIRLRRWFQPLANFGQMMSAAVLAGVVLDLALADIGVFTPSGLTRVALVGAVASMAYTAVQLLLIRFAVRTVYGARNLLPWSGTHFLFSSQVMMGVVGGLLGGALQIVDRPAVIVLIMAVYLIAHLSLSSYSQLREAHQAALRGFVKSLEARDLYTRGHTERVAYFAQLIGEQLHYTGTQLERLRWASLIHDLGKLAIPGELVAKRGQLHPEEFAQMRDAARTVEGILAEVDFLKPMVSIAGVHYFDEDDFDPAKWTLDASIVATADSFEAMTATRSYRMAMSQTEAFEALRRDPTGRYEPDVIDALKAGLERTGEIYGGPPDRDETKTEALAESHHA